MKLVFAFLYALSLLTACGSEDDVRTNTTSATKAPQTSEIELQNSLPEIAPPSQMVIVVPWEAKTHDFYLQFKTHSYDQENGTLTVSTTTPNENWFYNALPYLVFKKQPFQLSKKSSTVTHDVFVRHLLKAKSYVSQTGQHTALPYRLEIRLYKDVNGKYTGECDYNVTFQYEGFWGSIKEIRDLAIHHSCPLHRI